MSFLSHDLGMKRPVVSSRKRARVSGVPLAVVGDKYALIRMGQAPGKAVVRSSDTARKLVSKAGQALSKPGISHNVVFRRGRSGIFAYSVYEQDPSKIVRISADGKKTIGRVIGGKFKSR